MSDTPWKRRSLRNRADRQEARNAKLPGGSKQVNSGRHWFSKLDNKLGGFLIETRFTDKGRYCIDQKEWEAMIIKAHRTPPGMHPAFQIDLGPHRLIVMEVSVHLDREQRLTDAGDS